VGRPREQHIPGRAQHAVAAHRSDDRRKGERQTEQRRAAVARAGVDERARREAVGIESLPVALEREFVLGAALDVLECEVGRPPPGEAAQFLDRDRAPEIPAGIVAAARSGGLSR